MLNFLTAIPKRNNTKFYSVKSVALPCEWIRQCLAIHFDADQHRPVCSREGLQHEHDAVKALVPQGQPAQYIRPSEPDSPVLEDTFRSMCQKASEGKQEARTAALEPAPKVQPMKGTSRVVSAAGMFDELFDIKKGEPESAARIEQEETPKDPTEFQRLVARHANLFTKVPPLHSEVPKGWLSTLEGSIDVVKTMELSMHIRGFHCNNGRLYALGEKAHMGLEALNSLLAATSSACPACGAGVAKAESLPEGEFPGEGEGGEESGFVFCDDCLRKAGFMPEKTG